MSVGTIRKGNAMDDAKIVATVLARDVLRREAQLPPLDIDLEIAKARLAEAGRAQEQHYESLCILYQKEREDIRDAAIREVQEKGVPDFPNSYSGHYGLHLEVEKRFKKFLSELD